MMTTLLKTLTNKREIIKNREADRMTRYLRILFGKEKFGFHWVEKGTSYTDGKDVYALYPFRKPEDDELFDGPAQRILRKATSVHERGHLEYDIIEHYTAWQKKWMSNNKGEWVANEKYPISWLQFFGNVMMDGRMEHLVATAHPTTQEYFDFKNYHWKVPIIEERQGQDQLQDFRTCFFRRAMAMTDYDGWIEESVQLVDTIQPLIEKARIASSTEECLNLTLEMIFDVWPTLLSWMDLENQEPDSFQYDDDHCASQWGESEEVEQNVQKVLVKIIVPASEDEAGEDDPTTVASTNSSADELEDESDNKDTDSGEKEEESKSDDNASQDDTEESKTQEPDFSKVLAIESKTMEKDEKEADDAIGPYAEREQEVTVWEHKENRPAYSEKVIIKPFEHNSLNTYNAVLKEIKRFINPTANALQQLLDPIMDETRRNQRSGKLKVNRAWRADTLGDGNVFDRRKKGTPGKSARLLLLNDISGSTGSNYPGTSHCIIDEMRKAQILMLEACEKANVQVASYGFTEGYTDDYEARESYIYPLKPYNRFTDVEKGFVGGLRSKWGNRDTISLQWAIDELATYPEDIRLLIMLSDGEPCFSDNEDFNTMRSIVLQAEKRGIDVLCLYVGPQDPRVLDNVRFMYPGRSIIVSKNLQLELSRHVKRVIRKRK